MENKYWTSKSEKKTKPKNPHSESKGQQ